MQSQTISVPVVFSQVNFSVGKIARQKSSANPEKSVTTTSSSSYSNPPVQTYYRTYGNNSSQSVFMSVSSSGKRMVTTKTTRINNNSNQITSSYFTKSTSSHTNTNTNTKNDNNLDVSFLLSLFSLSFKYIFIITANVIDKLIFIVINPVETFIYLSDRITEIRLMKRKIDELTYERDKLEQQGDQLMAQLTSVRISNRCIETSYKAMKQKRDILKDTLKALQNEIQRERESRYVVEKCHNERIEKLEFELDMKDQEIIKYEDKERLLKKKIHKLQKKIKQASSSKGKASSNLSLPTFSLQNFDTFTFDDSIPSVNDKDNKAKESVQKQNSNDNQSEDLYYSSEDENFIFAKDSDAESCSDSNLESESESDSESDSDSNVSTDSNSEFDSESDIDIEAVCITQREIPKDSIYYNFARRQADTMEEDEEDDELELNGKTEQNPLYILRQEAYNCLYQSIVSELCTSSILMDLDVKMDKKNFTSYTCISIILEALIHYLEVKDQLMNNEAIENLFIRYRPLILNYTDTEEDQMNLLVSLEYICIENSVRLQQHLRILMAIYKLELVDPQSILKWYHLIPDSEETNNHGTCPMTPSINCVLPKLPLHHNSNSNLKIAIKNHMENDGSKCIGQMIDGHYATKADPSSLNEHTTIHLTRSNSYGGNDVYNNNTKKSTENDLLGESVSETNNEMEQINKTKTKTTKSKTNNSHGGRSGHARTASGSSMPISVVRRRRSMSNISDSGSHEIYYIGLRKNIRELAKIFALWLESKVNSSSDEESILDNMSMSQDLEDEDSEESENELRRLHRKLLSDEDTSYDTNSNSIGEDGDDLSDLISISSSNYSSSNGYLSPLTPITQTSVKKCKKVTFNLSHMNEKDEDETVHNEDNKKIKLDKNCPLLACLENNPLNNCINFDFDTMDDEDESDDSESGEEIIEEVEEVIEEEVVEEIIEEFTDEEDNLNNEDDESVTIVEEKEEVIDEVVK